MNTMHSHFLLAHFNEVSDNSDLLKRLTEQSIDLLCGTSFSKDDLESDDNKLMYIFIEVENQNMYKFIGFCRIDEKSMAIDRFEIFNEWRKLGYGRIFVNQIKCEFGITDYYQIMDDTVGFWFNVFSDEENLFVEMLSSVLKGTETFENFCVRLNYCEHDVAYSIFKSILEYYKQNPHASQTQLIETIKLDFPYLEC